MSTWNAKIGGPELTRRRSQRVVLTVAVTVRTEGDTRDTAFEEETRTLIVNVHGGLIALEGKVDKGHKLRLTNRATQQEELCLVVYVGPASGGKAQIGVEFVKPSPDFWRICSNGNFNVLAVTLT